MNENFDIFINFPKGSVGYQFVLSIVFRKRLIFPLFGEEILKFGLLKFFLGLCCWQRPRTFFVSWCISTLFCFFRDGNGGRTGDRLRLNEIYSVSP